ncbi:hypothetical protein HN935_02155 [archaeon]|jgi:hypothetical protein|nr:hypothetical protein [archaeon]
MKKFGVIVFALVLVFSFGFVAAASCGVSDDSQLIMRLYQENNSHGALWNDTNGYDVEICVPEGVDVGDHVSGFKLYLSDVFNGHVSNVSDAVYDQVVGFGDNLNCEYVEGDCPEGFGCVVTLSAATNAHLATCGAGAYSNKVCCGGSEIMWADMNGDLINSADLGDTVQMIKTYAGSGSFDIFENDDSLFEFLVDVDDEIRTGLVGDDVGSNLVGKWTITREDLGRTEYGDYTEFRFIVDGETSEALNINPKRNDSKMIISIEDPACGSSFDVGGPSRQIGVIANDVDDEIVGSLSVLGVEVDTFGNEEVLLDHPFGVPGNVQIIAEANNTRGKISRSVSSVMVLDRTVDGKYSAACIDRPRNFEDFDGNSIAIDASTSRAVRVTNGGTTATVIVPGDPGLNWYWTFSRRDGNHEIRNVLGVAGEELIAYNFTAEFPSSGNNWATLGLDLV